MTIHHNKLPCNTHYSQEVEEELTIDEDGKVVDKKLISSNTNGNQNENKIENQNVQKDGQGNVHGQRMTCEHDIKYADLSHGFKKYLSCQNGQMKQETCPRGSIFYFLIQCCVPISKYPCKSNCIGVPGKNVYEMDSYDYFNYWWFK